jgi:hypothetical protein
MKRLNLKTCVVIIVSIALSSCTSLRAVNDFSSVSSKGLAKFEEIPNSFTQHCIDRCVFESIRKFEIKRTSDCNCDTYQKADSITMLIYLSIHGYFDGLKAISEKDVTHYKLDALKTSLTAGTFGDIKIDQQQAGAYSIISNILLDAVTGSYRKNKIKNYVEQANQPIQVLLNKFQFILQKNLEGELNFKKEKLYAFYRELLLNDALNDYEKEKAATDYYHGLSIIKEQQERIDLFAGSLGSIAEGHQKIYDNRNKLTGKELRDSLVVYQSAISNAVSQFNKLKN